MRKRILFFGWLLCLPALAWAAADATQAEAWLKDRDPRAEAAIEALLKASPRDARVAVLETRLRLRQNRAKDALRAAERAVELAPDSAQAHLWLGNATAVRIGEVGMLSKAMMAPRIRDAYLKAIALDPDTHEARENLVEFYLQAPSIAGGDPEQAKAQAAELARRDPPRGHAAAARIAAHEGRHADAAADFEKAYRARPAEAGYRMAAGLMYQQAQAWDQAFRLFEAWTGEDPAAAGAWYQLGRTSALSGQRTAVGIAALTKFLALPSAPGQPEPKHAWYRLGQVQAHAGDTAAARASLQRALAIDPKLAEAKEALAKL